MSSYLDSMYEEAQLVVEARKGNIIKFFDSANLDVLELNTNIHRAIVQNKKGVNIRFKLSDCLSELTPTYVRKNEEYKSLEKTKIQNMYTVNLNQDTIKELSELFNLDFHEMTEELGKEMSPLSEVRNYFITKGTNFKETPNGWVAIYGNQKIVYNEETKELLIGYVNEEFNNVFVGNNHVFKLSIYEKDLLNKVEMEISKLKVFFKALSGYYDSKATELYYVVVRTLQLIDKPFYKIKSTFTEEKVEVEYPILSEGKEIKVNMVFELDREGLLIKHNDAEGNLNVKGYTSIERILYEL